MLLECLLPILRNPAKRPEAGLASGDLKLSHSAFRIGAKSNPPCSTCCGFTRPGWGLSLPLGKYPRAQATSKTVSGQGHPSRKHGASSTTDSSPTSPGTRLPGRPGTATQGPSLRPAFRKLETYCPLSPWGSSSEGRQLNRQFRCTLINVVLSRSGGEQ